MEEYVLTDGEYKLVKRKVTTREIPPDIKAVKLLLDGGNDEAFSDEELEEEKQRLLKLLKHIGFLTYQPTVLFLLCILNQ